LKVGTGIDSFVDTGSVSLAVTSTSGCAGAERHSKNKKAPAMLKQPKFRQAGLILFATTVVLILPNLGRLFGSA